MDHRIWEKAEYFITYPQRHKALQWAGPIQIHGNKVLQVCRLVRIQPRYKRRHPRKYHYLRGSRKSHYKVKHFPIFETQGGKKCYAKIKSWLQLQIKHFAFSKKEKADRIPWEIYTLRWDLTLMLSESKVRATHIRQHAECSGAGRLSQK